MGCPLWGAHIRVLILGCSFWDAHLRMLTLGHLFWDFIGVLTLGLPHWDAQTGGVPMGAPPLGCSHWGFPLGMLTGHQDTEAPAWIRPYNTTQPRTLPCTSPPPPGSRSPNPTSLQLESRKRNTGSRAPKHLPEPPSPFERTTGLGAALCQLQLLPARSLLLK